MQKEVKIILKVDAKTGAITTVKNSLGGVEQKAIGVNSALDTLKGRLLVLGASVGGLYAVSKALGFVVESGWEANKTMDASVSKLTAMISASRGYATVTGQSVSAMQRQKLVAMEVNATMQILKKTNAQTAMGMSELIDVYALAKPGMDKANWALKDQMEILKLVTNTASNFGVSAEELSNGIDDMAAGTWDATSGFGKMMKALDVTKEAFGDASDKVAFLKEKLKETGEAQDTWAVATSNLSVAWEGLTSQITKPVFDIAKEGVKELTNSLSEVDSSEIDGVSDALVEMTKISIKAGAWVVQSFKGVQAVIGSTKIAFYGLVHYLAKSMEWVLDMFKRAGRGIEEIFVGAFNVISKKWNQLIDGFASSAGIHWLKKSFDIDMSGINALKMDEIKLDKYKPVKLDLKWSKLGLDEAIKDTQDAIDGLITQEPLKKADEFIQKIDKILQKSKEVKKISTDPKNQLVKKSYTIPIVPKIDKNALKVATKKAKEEGEELNKEVTLDFATQFKNMFDSLLKGDIAGAIKGLFNGISMELIKNPIDKFSKYLGDKVSSIFSGFGGFANLFGGLSLGGFGSLFGNLFGGLFNSEETPPELESMHLASQSIKNSLSLIKNAQNPLLNYTKKQTEYLSIIAKSFGNVEKNLLSSGIDFGGDFYKESTKGGIFSTKSYELYGTDIRFNTTTIADAIAGNWAAYSDEVIKKTYDSWFKHKTSYSTNSTDISSLIAKDMANATNTMFNSLIDSSNLLGMNIDINKLLSESIDIGKIDTTGMSGEDIANEIENRYSAEIDRIVSDFFGDALYEFQNAGEGLAETLNRVSVTFEQTADLLGQVGQQINWQNANYLVDASGGMEEFNSLWNSYIDNFYSDAEKWNIKQRTLTESFDALNIKMPETKAEFRDLLETFDISDKNTSETYAQLLKLSPLLGEYFNWVEESSKGIKSVLTEQKKAQEEQLNNLKSQLSFYDKLLNKIDDLYNGSLSYLNVFEKQAYFANRSKIAESQNKTDDYLESVENRLEYDKQITTTREEYAYMFNSYIAELKTKKPKKTLDDVVLQIEDLKNEISDTRKAIEYSGKETVRATTDVANAVEASLYTAKVTTI